MGINKFTSLEKYCPSVGTKEICILVTNDDPICCKIVASMLKHCINEVFAFERVEDVINAIWERKERLEAVFTNIPRTNRDSFGIIKKIEEEFKLSTVVMRHDLNTNKVSSDLASGAKVCFMKNMTKNDIRNLYHDVLIREKDKEMGMELQDNAEMPLISEVIVDELGQANTSSGDGSKPGSLRKREKEASEENEDRDVPQKERKQRVHWTPELHRLFEDAIEQLGPEKAVPKKIVELMGVQGMTRENVASHLQKHRLYQKRNQGISSNIFSRFNLTNNVKAPSLYNSPSRVNFSQQPSWRSAQLGSRSTISMSSYNYSSIFSREASASNYSRFQQAQSCTPFDAAPRVNFGTLQQMDQIFPVNQNYRVYGDQTKNILLNVENRSTYNVDYATSSSTSNNSFIGLRLANDGKAVTFGDTCNAEKKMDMEFSATGHFGNKKFEALESYFPLEENFDIESYLLPLATSEIDKYNQFPSTSNIFVPQHESLTPNFGTSTTTTTATMNNFVPQEELPIPNFGMDGNESFDPFPLELIESLLEEEISLPPSPSKTFGNESVIKQLPSLPANDIPENKASPLSFQFESNDLGFDGSMDDLLQGTESSNDPLLWEGDLDDTFFNLDD